MLWSVLSILLYRVVEWTRTDMRQDGNLWVELVKMPLWPSTGLWYLLALPLFLTAVRAAQDRLAPRVQLVLAGLLALAFGAQWLNTGNKFYDGMAMYFVFFVVGAHARTLVFQASRRVTTAAALGVTAAYLVLTGTVTAGGWLSVPTVRPLFGCVAFACGVALSSRVADGWPGRALAVVGRQTLPIYVANELLLWLLALLVRPLAADGLPMVLAVCVPPVLAVVSVVLALGLHRVLGKVPGLYAPPEWLTRRPVRGTALLPA